MKITAANIYDCKLYPYTNSYNLVFLLLETDKGLEGLGEVSLAYGAGATAAVGMLRQLAERFLLGADPMRIEEMWNRLFRGTFWGQGGGLVPHGAMSAIDAALWDIRANPLACPRTNCWAARSTNAAGLCQRLVLARPMSAGCRWWP